MPLRIIGPGAHRVQVSVQFTRNKDRQRTLLSQLPTANKSACDENCIHETESGGPLGISTSFCTFMGWFAAGDAVEDVREK